MTAQKVKKDSELEMKIYSYLQYLEVEKGASPLTIRNYNHYLNRFTNWLEEQNIKKTLSNINPQTMRDYRIYLSRLLDAKGNSLTKRTQGYHAIAIRSFLKWLIKNDYKVMSPDKIDLPKIEDRQIKFLTGDQIDRLLSAPSLSKITGKRDKAILEVLFSTGLRVSELVKLDRERLDLQRREFNVIGKGGRSRVVFLSKRAADWVENYLKARSDRLRPLFIRHKGKMDVSRPDEKMRLTPRSVQRMVKKYARKVKIAVDVTPHVLRHSFATDLLIAGADLRSVQEMLGHKNIVTTQVYTHVTDKHLKDIHEAFHAKGR